MKQLKMKDNYLLKYYSGCLSSVFGGWFPGLSSSPLLSSLWLFPYLGSLQVAAYHETGVKRSHFVGVVLFGLVLTGCDEGAGGVGRVVHRSRFAAVSVVFFGLTRHYSDKVFGMLISAGYIELKYKGGRGPCSFYGWTEKGQTKWGRVSELFNKRLSERAAVLRHMEAIGKPVRFDSL